MRSFSKCLSYSRTAEYLLSLPKLGDYLEDGLIAMEEAKETEEGAEA